VVISRRVAPTPPLSELIGGTGNDLDELNKRLGVNCTQADMQDACSNSI
jgi:hypothetical protein